MGRECHIIVIERLGIVYFRKYSTVIKGNKQKKTLDNIKQKQQPTRKIGRARQSTLAPPPQPFSIPLQYCLVSVVSLHVLFSGVVEKSSYSESPSRKTNEPLIAWKLMSHASFVSSSVLTNIHASPVPTLHFFVSFSDGF